MERVKEHICAHCGNDKIHPKHEECKHCSSTLKKGEMCTVCNNRNLWYDPDSNPRDVVIGERAKAINEGGIKPEVPGVTHPDKKDVVPWCGRCNKLF